MSTDSVTQNQSPTQVLQAQVSVSTVPGLLSFSPSTEKSDAGNATRLLERHGANLRYVPKWKKWLIWNGVTWQPDESGRAMVLAEDTLRSIYHQAGDTRDAAERKAWAKFAIGCETEKRLRSMLTIAQSRPEIPVEPDTLDADPMLFNFANGTVDLRTGTFREHRKDDLITKKSPVEYDPNATCPTWLKFLDTIMDGNKNLISFLQRAIGYSLTGRTDEQCMFILYGGGANGKSTLCDVLNTGMGDYGMVTPSSTLMAKNGDAIPNDVARLQGVRFVTAAETDDNRRFAEGTIKQLTGDKKVSARFMRGEYFEFTPILKLFLSTNHKPQIKGTDNGIWRRLKLIPFTVTIPTPQQDKHLYEKLIAELPGIMLWTIQGCLEWQSLGLSEPPEVLAAINEYRDTMDVLKQFLEEECVCDPASKTSAKELYAKYTAWCEENGEKAEAQRKFGQRLFERGFDRVKLGNMYYIGLRLRKDEEEVTHGGMEDQDQKSALHPGSAALTGQSGKKVQMVQSSTREATPAREEPEHLKRLHIGMQVSTPQGSGVIERCWDDQVAVNIMGKWQFFRTPLQIQMIDPLPGEYERFFPAQAETP